MKNIIAKEKLDGRRKYTLDLTNIMNDSHEKYYWLGFIAADGAIINNTLSIELNSIDKEHLKLFNDFFENTKDIEESVNNLNVKCAKVQINSYELVTNPDVRYLKNYYIKIGSKFESASNSIYDPNMMYYEKKHHFH